MNRFHKTCLDYLKRMRRTRLSLVACALGLVTFSTGAQANISWSLQGKLTQKSFLATDGGGTFYYDLYRFENVSPQTVSLKFYFTAGDSLAPYAAYWTTTVLPAANWASPVDLYSAAASIQDDPNPGAVVTFDSFDMPANSMIQVAITTYDYNETGATLDSYQLDVITNADHDGDFLVTAVPEPGATGLFVALSLAGLCFVRRRAR